MSVWKKSLILMVALAGGVFLSGCFHINSGQGVREAPDGPDGALIHLSNGSNDPHRALMALRMAELMSTDHPVIVYVDIKGIELVLKDAPNLEMDPFPGSRAQIRKLLDSGVKIYACPGCLKAAEKTAADLEPGVQVASKDAFFQFTRGRILTLDY